jgi:hypothetical protein
MMLPLKFQPLVELVPQHLVPLPGTVVYASTNQLMKRKRKLGINPHNFWFNWLEISEENLVVIQQQYKQP